MDILITKSARTEHGFNFEGTCGKKSACIMLWDDGGVWMVCTSVVTAHRLPLGKSFPSIAAARDAYKSSAMKALISAAATASLSIAA